MRQMQIVPLVFLAAALSAAALVFAKESPNTTGPIDPRYREMYFEQVPPTTGPALTIDLGTGGRLTIPPRFAEQDVLEVKRVFYLGPGFEDAVVVGLHAGVPNGPTQAFALIYGGSGSQRVLKAELPLQQYYVGCEVLTLGQESVLAIHGASGAHFDDLWVYRFRDDKPELLLAQGSAAGVELRSDAETGNPQVWVGVENWNDPNWNYATGDRRWNVYTWNGGKFSLKQELSTAPFIPAEQRAEGYVHAVMKNLQSLKPDEKLGGSDSGESGAAQ